MEKKYRPSAANPGGSGRNAARPPRADNSPGTDRPVKKRPYPAPRAEEGDEGDKGERIAKRLARAGIASRREAETMIAAGRVAVNGRVLASPAVNVKRTDAVTVDGSPLPVKERTRLWLYHKPAGLLTTARDEQGRPTVFAALPADLPRVLSVGRLDMNTEGLLLLTNDGGLKRVLELPSTGWVRQYRVRAHGKVSQAQLDGLKDGTVIDGIFYGAAEAKLEREQGSNVWISIALREGKNHEIKNILGSLGLSVNRLIRISFGPFQLADLASGAVREIRGRALRDQLGSRLAAEAEADFDAPIITPFANAGAARPASGGGRDAGRYGDEHGARGGRDAEKDGWISSGRRRFADKAEPQPWPERKQRSANVWHAPGSRVRKAPLQDLAAEDAETAPRSRRLAEGRARADRAAGAGNRQDRERRPSAGARGGEGRSEGRFERRADAGRGQDRRRNESQDKARHEGERRFDKRRGEGRFDKADTPREGGFAAQPERDVRRGRESGGFGGHKTGAPRAGGAGKGGGKPRARTSGAAARPMHKRGRNADHRR